MSLSRISLARVLVQEQNLLFMCGRSQLVHLDGGSLRMIQVPRDQLSSFDIRTPVNYAA